MKKGHSCSLATDVREINKCTGRKTSDHCSRYFECLDVMCYVMCSTYCVCMFLCLLYAPIHQNKFQVGVNLLGNKYDSDSDSDSDFLRLLTLKSERFSPKTPKWTSIRELVMR